MCYDAVLLLLLLGSWNTLFMAKSALNELKKNSYASEKH